jgi:uncharacterized protein YkwD
MQLPGVRTLACFLAGFGLVVSLAAEGLGALNGPEADVFASVNRVRREHHLVELRASPELARVALAHARDLAARGTISHHDAQGRNPLERTQAAGVSGFRLLAENVAASSDSGDRIATVVREWLASPDHRENLLNPAFNTTGVAVVEASGTSYCVQLFATYER